MIDKYILCFDTDKYAGNFERETTAYATGVLGDCQVGDEQSTQFFAETDGVADSILDEIENSVLQVPDEHGCYRPCAIQPTPGWVNDGLGTHYRQSSDVPPTEEQIEKYRKNDRDYHLPHLKNAREYTAKGIANWTPEGLEREEERFKEIETKVPSWFPAYNSVGIYLDKPLSDETLKFVVARAKAYLTFKGITLEQVRLVTQFSDEKSEVLEICG
jgi:hypothetical protein